jgi:hypothetical protein
MSFRNFVCGWVGKTLLFGVFCQVAFGQTPEEQRAAAERALAAAATDNVVKAEIDISRAREEAIRTRAEALAAADRLKKAKKAAEKNEDKYTEKARKQIEKGEKKLAEEEREEERALLSAEISGCEDSAMVYVHPEATRGSWKYSFLRINVTNPGDLPIKIRTGFRGLGDVVKDLCPRGSLILTFRAKYGDFTNLSNSSPSFVLEAVALPGDGRILIQEKKFKLPPQNRGKIVWSKDWVVKLSQRRRVR